MKQDFGQNHYTFFGECESRNDPLEAGRIQVRIFGHHTRDRSVLPTELLPWCQCLLPVTSTDTTMSNIQIGTVVYGFFLDGEDKQIPMITHVIGGLVADGVAHYLGYIDKTLSGFADGRFRSKPTQVLPLEKNDPYAAVYPFNHASESESGHVFEVDDTPGAERIHVLHRAGSFIEIHPDGSIVKRSAADTCDVSVGDHATSCQQMRVEVGADYSIKVSGNAVINVAGNSQEKVGGSKTIEVGGDFVINAGG